jgi:hypothetical protein
MNTIQRDKHRLPLEKAVVPLKHTASLPTHMDINLTETKRVSGVKTSLQTDGMRPLFGTVINIHEDFVSLPLIPMTWQRSAKSAYTYYEHLSFIFKFLINNG